MKFYLTFQFVELKIGKILGPFQMHVKTVTTLKDRV